MSTASDNITLNLGSGGPVVATDYVSTAGKTGHIQYVKLDYGNENAHQPVTSSSPLPTSISSLPSNWLSLPVGGGTGGQGITINGTINAAFVGITNGTLGRISEGVSVDVRGFGGKTLAIGNTQEGIGLIAAGVSVDVRGVGTGLTVGVTFGADGLNIVGGVNGVTLSKVAAGITIGIETIGTENAVSITTGTNFVKVGGLPQDMTFGTFTCDNESALGSSFPTFNALKSLHVKNLPGRMDVTGITANLDAAFGLGVTNAAPVLLGSTQGTMGLTSAAGLAPFRVLLPGDEVTIELKDIERIFVRSITGGNGATQSMITFHAS